MKTTMTTQAQVRASFWESHPQFTRRGRATQNDYSADIRTAFVDYVDSLAKSGEISQEMAHRVTL